MRSKAIELFSAGVILAMILIGSVLMILMPTLFLKKHLVQIVEYTYDYNNAQLYLLTLLSLTHNGIPVYDQIGGNIQTGSPDVSFLASKLDTLITDSHCYTLSTSKKILVPPQPSEDCTTPTKYVAQTRIVLPYKPGKLTEDLKLVID